MRTVLLVAALCGCGLLLATAASAAPSHFGPTGIVATPTADVVGAQTYDVAVDYMKWDNLLDDDEKVTSWLGRLVAGVSDNVEVGVGYLRWTDGDTVKAVPVNVKAMLVPESETSPSVSVGAAYGKLKDSDFDVKVTTFYAVATKTLSQSEEDYYDEGGMKGTVRGSLGVMYNKYEEGGFDDSATEPFASLEFIAPNGLTTIAVEYKTKEDIEDFSNKAISSVVLRHMFTSNVWAQAGLTNAAYTGGEDDHEWFVGIGYRWMPPVEEEYYY